jgi:hypothetical protein
MVIITVSQKEYKENTTTILAEKEEENSLLSSFDFCSEDLIEKDDRDNYFFIENTIIRYYDVDSSDNSTKDIEIIDCLKDFAMSDSHELRYWFKDIPVGKWELKTYWEYNEPDDINLLIYDDYAPLEDENEKGSN